MVTFSFSALSDASTRLPPVSVWSYLLDRGGAWEAFESETLHETLDRPEA